MERRSENASVAVASANKRKNECADKAVRLTTDVKNLSEIDLQEM